MRHRLQVFLILLAMVATTLAWFWGWTEYKSFVMRQRLSPIPIPAPP
jgi:hypothetical protein